MNFVKGDVVLVNFYFTDVSSSKKRPALVLAVSGDDYLIAEITSKSRTIDNILIKKQDFQEGNLREDSWLRPLRLGTFHKSLIVHKIGHLKASKLSEVVGVICGFLKN